VVVRLHRSRGSYERALDLLEKLCSAAEEAGRTGGLIEALALQALTLWDDNRKRGRSKPSPAP
jgi:hypothetical protein